MASLEELIRNQRWNIPDEVIDACINRLKQIIEDPRTKPRDVKSAVRQLIKMEKTNQLAEELHIRSKGFSWTDESLDLPDKKE